jgi:hypothetical protein
MYDNLVSSPAFWSELSKCTYYSGFWLGVTENQPSKRRLTRAGSRHPSLKCGSSPNLMLGMAKTGFALLGMRLGCILLIWDELIQ